MLRKNKLLLSLIFLVMGVSVLLPVSVVEGVEMGDVCDVIQDSFTTSLLPDTNYGATAYWWSGYTYTPQGYMVGHVDVNTTQCPVQTVPFVYLKLYGYFAQYEQDGYDWCEVDVYVITEAWNETGAEGNLTYNNQPTKTKVDTLNITTWTDDSYQWTYFNVTDSWDEYYGLGFTGFHGYALYFRTHDQDGDNISWFNVRAYDYDVGQFAGSIYYSSVALDYDGSAFSGGSGSGTSDVVLGSMDYSEFIDYMILFMLIFVPALLLAGISGMAGFASGLCLGSVLGISAGILPAYATLIVGIVLVVFVVRGGSGK